VEYKVLDHGIVKLVDVMGNDSSIVQAARVSYGEGTKSVSDDRNLIRYLMRHQHTTPFEMVEMKFLVKLPIFVARQWIRHRTASVNEYSGRYSIMLDEYYIPENLHSQSQLNKQGSSDVHEYSMFHKIQMIEHCQSAFQIYEKMVKAGISREEARIILPLNTYTQWYWKIDLNNLFKFLVLRLDSHAQYEIRVYAEKIAEIVKSCCPLAYEAFEDYMLNSIKFSAPETYYLNVSIKDDEKKLLSKREIKELEDKVDK
jgi:thymidylate synthase (FAD)